MSNPNIIIILNDDMGYSDIGCYGSEIETPNLDSLALNGLRYSQFYSTPRCSPSRASIMTGLHPHQTGIGILTYYVGPEGYSGNLTTQCNTIPEILKTKGYSTYLSGKWHITSDLNRPNGAWPTERGFDEFYGTIIGAGSFYNPNTLTRGTENIEHEAQNDPDFFYTDAISDQAAKYITTHTEKGLNSPFFLYVAYTAPHWPLHAHEEDIAKYKGRFDKGWDELRRERLLRLVKLGLVNPKWELTERDPTQPPFENVTHKEWETRRMEVYAAQIDRMDQGIGRILDALESTGQLDDTLILFLSDNGGCAEDIPDDVEPSQLVEDLQIARYKTRDGRVVNIGNDPEVMPGPEDTYQSYGTAWANVSNAPFRLYKHWAHEGGISTPLIAHWPNGINEKSRICHEPGQLTDVMATILDLTKAEYPKEKQGIPVPDYEGKSLVPTFNGKPKEHNILYWEHEGNAAVRDGKWKLVSQYPGPWELYNMEDDRTEMHDMSDKEKNIVSRLGQEYDQWASRCGVIPRSKILDIMKQSGEVPFWEEDEL